ncbi:MAG: Domain protein of unknown function [Devosia sp.]|uniref:DUF4345 domain-containing protein n=1 Tax=Devosia sp. TaxID=1871048 RepID=UPI00261CC539|nr:DUF4345 domain-containing protein [Devosia sp.]MDB5527086.1 Domain protein of unknown function [Devosia sp.]
MPSNRPSYLLRAVLILAGAAIVFLGLNVGLGGIQTLGWQGGSAPFLTVLDPQTFGVRDNHVRFIGGVWLGLGLVMLAGGFAFSRLRTALLAFMAMIFVGGLARFSAFDPAVLLNSAVAPSLLLELVLFPLLALWIAKAERPRKIA